MIEVIISMGLIALVLLSLLTYQINMLKNCFQLNLKTIAHNQLMNFSEMLLVNTGDAKRNAALFAWNEINANILPQGNGELTEISEHQCEITINWFFKKQATESIVVFC
ncbi:MAG: hypothetical protein A3F13_05120 [Gammaproteobacteria bacterium RIFCSPHIGHO2_12_FULL_40_19]|nr:MAG: hypothetical protein A3F13_05120 [Gammaproteobacteria bacterium RIFCSPHIGHO2_12_FULL_40_19]